MESIILENGSTTKNMALEFGNQLKEIYTWVSGRKEKFKATEPIYVELDKSMREILLTFLSMEKEPSSFRMVMCFRVYLKKENLMDSVFINGKMEWFTKEISSRATDQEKEK